MGTTLVTGGAGFIGSHLVDRLLDRGAGVRVLDNLFSGALRNLQAAADGSGQSGSGSSSGRRLELMVGDVRDERLVRKAMRHVDCVFHFAAVHPGVVGLGRQGEIDSVNVHGTLNVLQAAAAEGTKRVIFASCGSVYGRGDARASAESDPPRPGSVFAASKLAAEVYCQAFQNSGQVETVVLRFFTVYGPRQAAGGALVPAMVRQLRTRRRPTVPGDGRAAEDFMYVDDAVTATLAAADNAAAVGRVINVASGQTASPIEVVDILNRLMRTDLVPRTAATRAATGAGPRPGIGLAKELLGVAPAVSLVAGLARVVDSLVDVDEEAVLTGVGLA